MSEREYWFARRFPLGDHRQAYAPVNWKGYLTSLLFVCALTGGGFAFAWIGAQGDLFMGSMVFLAVAIVAGAGFMMTAKANGDPVRTVAEYRKDRKQGV